MHDALQSVAWTPTAAGHPVHEAGTRTDGGRRTGVRIATFRCDAPARCGARRRTGADPKRPSVRLGQWDPPAAIRAERRRYGQVVSRNLMRFRGLIRSGPWQRLSPSGVILPLSRNIAISKPRRFPLISFDKDISGTFIRRAFIARLAIYSWTYYGDRKTRTAGIPARDP
jgi:hypothetical protein